MIYQNSYRVNLYFVAVDQIRKVNYFITYNIQPKADFYDRGRSVVYKIAKTASRYCVVDFILRDHGVYMYVVYSENGVPLLR